MYVCEYVSVYQCMYVYIYWCTNVCMCIYIGVPMYVCEYVSVCLCMCLCISMPISVRDLEHGYAYVVWFGFYV